ncbi:NAD(P)-binding protein [Pseudonocardia sp. NPDC049154]|uniref:NAD(P)-binding protein n=1 Tax=Pseudonocardia sp. NPDC049154 TaxID=3155501 RepID=UPI0033CC8C27
MTDLEVDAAVVRGGHHGLVAAAVLADAGWDVCLLGATGHLGGAVRSAELHPGYVTDLFSAFYPLSRASPALQSLDRGVAGSVPSLGRAARAVPADALHPPSRPSVGPCSCCGASGPPRRCGWPGSCCCRRSGWGRSSSAGSAGAARAGACPPPRP